MAPPIFNAPTVACRTSTHKSLKLLKRTIPTCTKKRKSKPQRSRKETIVSQSCLKYVIENRKVQDLSLESFDLNQRLGQGSWGNVYLARHKVTGYICALKAIEKCGIIKGEQEKLLRRELEIHQNLAHPNIIRFLGWFHNETHVYLILEYAPGGDLRTKLFKQKNKRFQEDIAAQYVAQVADAMNYMHSKNIMHRDIKLENILVGLYGEAKLADFGCSIHTPSGRRRTCCGTRDYMAPEIAIMFRQSRRDREPYSHGVDSWSLGVLAYHLMVGKTPFISSTTTQTLHRILSFTGSLNVPGYVTVSKEGRAFMNELMNIDANKRPSLPEVLQHPWIKKHCKTVMRNEHA